MYNKLFTKILDSTIWLESDSTRLVWITFLATMDEDGFVALSSVGNVAARARVSTEAAEAAIRSLEAPDANDPQQEHEGRRIERVPSGWMVLNAAKYRDIVHRAESKAANRRRVAKHRERKATVMQGSADVMPRNVSVMQSDTDTNTEKQKPKVAPLALPAWLDADQWNSYVKTRPSAARKPESLQAAIAKLAKFRDEGHDPNEIVATSLANGWRMLKAPEVRSRPVAVPSARPSIVCIACNQRAFTWTGDRCDPCWRKSQGMAA